MTEWISWDGGECPIPDAKAGEYEIHFRNGYKKLTFDDAIDRDWSRTPEFYNSHIIAYRLIEKEQSDLDWLEGEINKLPIQAEVNSMKGIGHDFSQTHWISRENVIDLIKSRKEAKP
jgi:hypothetical protein